jgi:hypothetical protein
LQTGKVAFPLFNEPMYRGKVTLPLFNERIDTRKDSPNGGKASFPGLNVTLDAFDEALYVLNAAL